MMSKFWHLFSHQFLMRMKHPNPLWTAFKTAALTSSLCFLGITIVAIPALRTYSHEDLSRVVPPTGHMQGERHKPELGLSLSLPLWEMAPYPQESCSLSSPLLAALVRTPHCKQELVLTGTDSNVLTGTLQVGKTNRHILPKLFLSALHHVSAPSKCYLLAWALTQGIPLPPPSTPGFPNLTLPAGSGQEVSWVSSLGQLFPQSVTLYPGLWQCGERKRSRKAWQTIRNVEESRQVADSLPPTTRPCWVERHVLRDQCECISCMHLSKENYCFIGFFKAVLLISMISRKIIHGIYITLAGCRVELAELIAKGARLNEGNTYESLVAIYWLQQGEGRGHGVFFIAWIRVLWWNEGALCWLNYKKCAPGPHKDLMFSPYSLTDSINEVHHNFCIIWKFNTCNCELLFFSEIANTAKL